MSIDIEEMVRMAGEREGWSVSRAEVAPPAVLDSRLWLVACDVQRDNADFIANAPATITALHQRARDLEARIAEMIEHTGAWEDFINSGMPLGEWLDRRP